MLSEEEKKAIKLIKQYRKEIKDGDIKPIFILDTAINLITKLQKENEEVKIKNKYLKLENGAYGNTIVKQDIEIEQKDRYIKNSEDITKEMNNDINKLLLEIKKKDKQINLMAEVIFKKFKAPLIIEYGIENKEQFIKIFEQKAKEKGKEYEKNNPDNNMKGE